MSNARCTSNASLPDATTAAPQGPGLWQRVREWNGSTSSSHNNSLSSIGNRASANLAHRSSSSFFGASERVASPTDGSGAAVWLSDDCNSSTSSSEGGDSHRSLLTSRSSNSSSPLGIFARTSSSVSSLKDHLGVSERGIASRSTASLDNMAILYDEPLLQGSDNGSTSSLKKHASARGSSQSVSRKRSKPSRTILYLRHRASAANVSVALMGLLLCILAFHRILSLYMNHRRWLNAPITYMQRQCPSPAYGLFQESMDIVSPGNTPESESTTASSSSSSKTPSICMVTFTDSHSPSWIQRLVRWRDYSGILELTWPNKLAYARKHGYHLFDHSQYLDTSRPPAWSKIPAMQALLQPKGSVGTNSASSSSSRSGLGQEQAQSVHCDWVLWTDADTVIMNSNIRITDFLPSDDTGLDLVVASDEGGGYNSGVLLFRNTEWSRQFLQTWWDMTSYVRPPGFSLSGDNAAMKALLRDMTDFDKHVAVPPRCTLNSFARFLTLRESKHVMETLEEQEWYMNERFYHKSDFIAHTPGYDNKAECIRLLLQEAE